MPASLLVTLVAGLWMGSIVQLAQTELRTSHSAFHFNSCLNLAEGAVEKGMLALNTKDWSGWTLSGGEMAMTEELDLGRGTTGMLRAIIYDYNTDDPRILTEGRIVVPNQPDVTRRLEVRLEKRRLFNNGFTFRGSFTFNGNGIVIDSYDSSLGPYDVATNRNAKGTIGSLSVTPGEDVDLGNSKIYGYVAIRSGDPSIGPNGNVSYLDAPKGTVEEERITRDFAATLAQVPRPDESGIPVGTINSGWTNPEAGNAPWTLGRAGEKTLYLVDAMNFNNETLTLVGSVEIVVLGDIDINSNGQLVVAEDSSAIIHAGNDVTMGGTLNLTADPKNLLIYGTHPTSQVFTLHGGSAWVASIYAPNADVELKGGASTRGQFYGAMVGNNLTVGGKWDIHYDEFLANFVAPFATYRVERWQERFSHSAGLAFTN